MVENHKHKLHLNPICQEDIFERRENELAENELKSYLKTISKCPYCPMKFVGTPAEMEKNRIEHIKREHPGKKTVYY